MLYFRCLFLFIFFSPNFVFSQPDECGKKVRDLYYRSFRFVTYKKIKEYPIIIGIQDLKIEIFLDDNVHLGEFSTDSKGYCCLPVPQDKGNPQWQNAMVQCFWKDRKMIEEFPFQDMLKSDKRLIREELLPSIIYDEPTEKIGTSRLKEDKGIVDQQLDNREREISELNAGIRHLKEQLDQAKEERESLREEVIKEKQRADVNQQKIIELELEIARKESLLEKGKKKIEKLEGIILEGQKTIQHLKIYIDNLELKIRELEREKQRLENILSRYGYPKLDSFEWVPSKIRNENAKEHKTKPAKQLDDWTHLEIRFETLNPRQKVANSDFRYFINVKLEEKDVNTPIFLKGIDGRKDIHFTPEQLKGRSEIFELQQQSRVADINKYNYATVDLFCEVIIDGENLNSTINKLIRIASKSYELSEGRFQMDEFIENYDLIEVGPR